ncbi:MAG: hypothetical protein J0L78_08860 [Planctomycetes bacterium]|nr:hypothetical protein [Planctomycetota bacterium]
MKYFCRLCVIALAVVALAATAHAGAKRPPKVLIIHAIPAAFSSWYADVQSKIASCNLYSGVSLFDARVATPPLSILMAHDAVLVFSDAPFFDDVALGNTLADYVDAGGGVVSCTFANASIPIGGRWAPDYLVINPLGQAQPAASLGTIADQNHPIMIGVTALSATQAFQSTGAVLPGNTPVAYWNNNSPLVAVSNSRPGRADLNFYPPSSNVRPDLWDTSGDGTKLMVNALNYVMRPRVLIAASPTTASWINDVKAKVRATGLVGITDTFNIATGTPSLFQLQAYDAVLAFTDLNPLNPVALGSVLADYVDVGGGVVTACFSQHSLFRITGRWANTYELITPSNTITGAASLGAVSYSAHPTMAGVASFSGGTSSFRPSAAVLNPGAFNIAQWSDGRPLVVASTKFHNRAELCFYPVSSTVRSDFWNAATDGGKLMANALVYTAKPYILVAAADEPTFQSDPVAKLIATRRFSGVGTFNLGTSTPALSVFTPYNGVISWSNTAYQNSDAVGNTLADYVDAGGGVVVSAFANLNTGFNATIRGRWPTGGYDICPTATLPGYTTAGPTTGLGALLEPNHPIARFVRRFDGGSASYRATSNPLLRGRDIMNWSDGITLASAHNFRKRADLGFYPGSSATVLAGSAWNQRTDGTWIMANALEFVVRAKPCPGDFNGDGQVDDADFVLFAVYYDTLVDPRGDLNGDGLTEDNDFVIFASSYDALVCP